MSHSALFKSYFSKYYVLTIKSNKKRHIYFQNQLQKLNLENFKIFFGKKYLFKSCFKNQASRGITNAHLDVHRLANKECNNNFIIFEDDITFVDNFFEKVAPIIEELKTKDWDIFYFHKPVKGGGDIEGNRGEIMEEYDSGLLKITGTIHTHAYAININSLPKIIKKFNLNYIKNLHLQIRVIDKSIATLKLNYYACNEDLIYQNLDQNFLSATKNLKPNPPLLQILKRYFKTND